MTKSILLLAITMLCVIYGIQPILGQQIKPNKHKETGQVSEEVKKDAEKYEKAGWLAFPNDLPIGNQLENSYRRQLETTKDGFPVWIVASGYSNREKQADAEKEALEMSYIKLEELVATQLHTKRTNTSDTDNFYVATITILNLKNINGALQLFKIYRIKGNYYEVQVLLALNLDSLNKEVYIELKQYPDFPKEYTQMGMSERIKSEVEQKIYRWQQKGEFEKTKDYLARVNYKNRSAKVLTFENEAIQNEYHKYLHYIFGAQGGSAIWNGDEPEVGVYDPDNETFLIKHPLYGEFALKVPITEAPFFKSANLEFGPPQFVISGYKFVLSHLLVHSNAITEDKDGPSSYNYFYDAADKLQYTTTKVKYNFEELKIDLNDKNELVNTAQAVNEIVVGKADVDVNIPQSASAKLNKYALIIGNEDYSSFQTNLTSEVNVDYAVHDAEVFKDYCVKTLGIPEEQIKFLKNATAAQIKQGLSWISNLARVENGKSDLVFYYSGHGLPDEQSKEPYIIPVDVSANNITDGVKLNDVYLKLSAYPSKRVSCFIDACFSGGARNMSLLTQKSIKIKPKETNIVGNMIVLSSSTGDESSGVYREKQHGYMTYFLLKKLQETKGDVNFKVLSDYVIENVRKATALAGKIQTPQLLVGGEVSDDLTRINIK